MSDTIPERDIRTALRSLLTVPVWSPDPGALTVASVMGWSRATAYQAVKDGRVPSIKISRSRYAVSTAALLRLVDGSAA